MLMSKSGLCCDGCFRLIAKKNTVSAKLWLDLCEIQAQCNIFGLVMPDNSYLRLLETLRFITTTDTPSFIVVKVHGEQEDELGPFFCGGKCGP